jgi:hypothetical protein
LLAAATTPRQPKPNENPQTEPPHRQPDAPEPADPANPNPGPAPSPEPYPTDIPTEPTEPAGPADPSNHPAAVSPAHPLTYESRITIVDAWQYPGTLVNAPAWVDRNWAAYAADFDPDRMLEPGPALRVPSHIGQERVCRVGDYVARQEVRLVADAPGEIRLEVWEKQQFERLFLPVDNTDAAQSSIGSSLDPTRPPVPA